MFIAILTSIKLYLNLNTSINDEIALSKDFYILSVNIFKVLSLKPEDREISPLQFLNDCYSNYIKLIEQSSLLRSNIKHDELTKLDINKFMSDDTEATKSRSVAAGLRPLSEDKPEFEILDDTIVRKVYFNRLPKVIYDFYFKEYDQIKTLTCEMNKPFIFGKFINTRSRFIKE
jgi:hypothetical protein